MRASDARNWHYFNARHRSAAGPNGTIYVVAMSKDASNNYFQRIHALDIPPAKRNSADQSIMATFPDRRQ